MSRQSETDIGDPLSIATRAFLHVEHALYIILGAVIAITACLALIAAILTLWGGVANIGSGEALLEIIDRLLFVLMLTEILHTVRVSFGSGTLDCEPFLIVGLIASIRRVLVITLESSGGKGGNPNAPPPPSFQSSMTELMVLAALILVMVISIYLLRRTGASKAEGSGPHQPYPTSSSY